MKSTNLKRHNFTSKQRIIAFIVAFAILGTFLTFLTFAATDNYFIEPETSNLSGNVSVVTDSGASAIEFGVETGGSGDLELPAPINPGDRDFGRIVRTTAPSGGVIVLPDGNYTVSDVSGFNPSNYVVVVAQNPLGVKVVRTSNTVGDTDQYFTSSSKVIFVGIDFKDIMLALDNVDDFYFWQTRHSFPISSHPDPSSTYCAYRQGPEAINIRGGSNRFGFYGSLIDGVGHDAFKLSNTSNLVLRGIKITGVDHGGLQQGRGNSSCGWDGNDNYHTDSIQIYPGGVSNMTLEDSYIGRNTMLQVEGGGASNTNLVIRNNVFFQEPPENGNCIAMNARVKTSAPADSVQTMTMQNNIAWCDDQFDWIFATEGTREGSMVINGTPIPASARQSNSYLTRQIGAPNTNSTPHETWRSANEYGNWPCYLEDNVPSYTQSIKSC